MPFTELYKIRVTTEYSVTAESHAQGVQTAQDRAAAGLGKDPVSDLPRISAARIVSISSDS